MDNFIRKNKKNLLTQLDNHADLVFRKTRRFLPHIARTFLILTFLEDGFRILMGWSEHIKSLKHLWHIPGIILGIYLLIDVICQFLGSALVIFRYKVRWACGILMFNIIYQIIGYQFTHINFLIRYFGLFGGLMMLLVESDVKPKTIMAGLPETSSQKPKQYVFLGGRLLLILIFLTLINWSNGFFYMIQSLANLVMILMVAVGYKTKLCTAILVTWLTLMNFWYNDFWNHYDHSLLFDLLRYDFFLTFSVIGGLLLIVIYGPGGVSFDDYKKDW